MSVMQQQNSKVKIGQSQSGVVSLLVTMVLMIVISLIALGFAQIARRNQGQQLDQQLSTQAFYAAESGVNDAAQIISTQLNAPNNVPASKLSKTTCADEDNADNNVYAPLVTNGSLGTAAENIAYTCVLINPSPVTLQTDISTTSKIIPVSASSNINSINLTWSSKAAVANAAAGCPTSVNRPTAPNWGTCGVGVLRVDLVPADNSVPSNATTLAEQTLTFFAVPMGSTGATSTVTYGGPNASTSNDNNIIGAHYQTAGNDWTVTINTAGYAHQAYDMRVSSEYEDSSLQVTAAGAAGNLPLSGAQVVIDATGKAQNVVRRIQVYVPIGIETNQLSDYAIESTDSVCKRYVVMNGYYQSEVGSTGVTANNSALDPLCQ
jgi:Tfp pilus assembly protein PilX